MSVETVDAVSTVVEEGQSYSRIVWGQFKKNTPALLSLYGIALLVLVALSADLIAGDKPYYMEYKGKTYFPAFRQYGIYLGFMEWPAELRRRRNFKKLKVDQAVYPPVPYAPGEILLRDKYQPPNAKHWLGTDRLGRDVLSGLIHGTRYALTIGLVAVGLSLVIGLALGAMAGYFGGWIDLGLSRLFELWAAIPSFFLILTAAAFFPPSLSLSALLAGSILRA
jgi:ABC-type microcin C transport system permease subunit YejE